MDWFLLCLALAVLVAWAGYRFVTANNMYFATRNIPYIKPTFFLGTTGAFFFRQYRIDEFADIIYKAFPYEKLVGMFDFRAPVIVVRDPDTIKQLAVKDFDHFEDHKMFSTSNEQDLFGNSLIMLRGQKWRDMRATLSPSFTGSKMRQMFELVGECAVSMVDVFKKRAASGDRIPVEMKELFGRFTTDVIASTAFGIKVNSFEDENNEFYVMGKKAMNFASLKTLVKFLMTRICPFVLNVFDIQIIEGSAARFFKNIVLSTMDYRRKEGIFRPDVINMLMQLKTQSQNNHQHIESANIFEQDSAGFATVEESTIGTKMVQREWSDNEIAAQCFLFFAAGFDTSSTCLSFFAYELGLNQDVQELLYQECVEVQEQLGTNGKLTYDVLQKMQYMDQVVSEVLRLWPPVVFTDRLCVRNYELKDGERTIRIEKGNVLWLPIFSIHHDEKYYQEPLKFKPDRFNEENKHQIVHGSYIPFGVGPRNCIGSRFALMEVKAVIYHMLLSFRIEPNEQTQIPIKLGKSPGGLSTERGFPMELKLR